MAAPQFSVNTSDQVQNSSYGTKSSAACGRSKAQLSLQKILDTILTIPPEPIAPYQPSSISWLQSSQNDTRNEDKSFVSDLNVDNLAFPALQTEDSQSAALVADEVLEQEKVEAVEEIKNGFCEGNNELISFSHEGQNISINQGEDCIGLLIEAAKLIFGEFKAEEKQQIMEDFDVSATNTRPEIKRKHRRWTTVELYADVEPVVRSKRGRTQVLPYKYRDSVLEPLTRVPRNRSNIIATKRRLR